MSLEPVQSSYTRLSILRGNITSLSLYEVTDHELDILEQGSPSGLYLNFSIFLFSLGVSFAITILTTNISDTRLFIIFALCAIVGIFGGILLLAMWYRTRKSVRQLCIKIRQRILQSDAGAPIVDHPPQTMT